MDDAQSRERRSRVTAPLQKLTGMVLDMPILNGPGSRERPQGFHRGHGCEHPWLIYEFESQLT